MNGSAAAATIPSDAPAPPSVKLGGPQGSKSRSVDVNSLHEAAARKAAVEAAMLKKGSSLSDVNANTNANAAVASESRAEGGARAVAGASSSGATQTSSPRRKAWKQASAKWSKFWDKTTEWLIPADRSQAASPRPIGDPRSPRPDAGQQHHEKQ